MLEINSNYFREYKTSNKGALLSVKIYPSERIKFCECGGRFTDSQELDDLSFPICDKCRKAPPLLRIRAKIIDDTLTTRYIDIRYDRSGKRLTDMLDCLTLLRQVKSEIAMGTFDVKRFDSKKHRESFLFENVVERFLLETDRRFEANEIKYYTQKNYHKYAKVLLRHFTGIDVATINKESADSFRYSDEFKEGKKLTNRDQGLSLLRTILKWSKDKGIIREVPDLGIIKSTRTRESLIDADKARKVIPLIKDVTLREAINVMFDYALRPNEVRALQIWDIDLEKNLVLVRRSFSGPVLSEDYERKSSSKGGLKCIEFPLTQHLKDYLIDSVTKRGLNFESREPVFCNSQGGYLDEDAMPQAWRETLRDHKLPFAQLYELRGSRASEIYELTGDITLASEFLGHTNINMTQKRYNRGKRDKSAFLDVAKNQKH